MISVEHLTKKYGEFTAVKDLSFEIEEGHVYGFLGPNGAGKSTTMNMMTGCLSATSGKVLIDGFDIFEDPKEAKKRVGYLPEQPPLYLNETPEEYLEFVGEAKGLKEKELKDQINEVIDKTRIRDVANLRISALSKGYKQRVGIAQALLGNPKVIILDEPTVGLDPIQIREIRDLIKQLGRDHTVILSSHILSEVQSICEKILIISHGELKAFDEPENLEASLMSSNEIKITTDATAQEVKTYLEGMEEVSIETIEEKENGYIQTVLHIGKKEIYDVAKNLFYLFAEHKRALLEINLKRANLEDIFMELTGADEEEIMDDDMDEDIDEDIKEGEEE